MCYSETSSIDFSSIVVSCSALVLPEVENCSTLDQKKAKRMSQQRHLAPCCTAAEIKCVKSHC